MLRDLQPEEMDDPDIAGDVHRHALDGLARINRYTRVAPAIYKRIRRFCVGLNRPLRVLDVASGGGDSIIDWAQRAGRDGLPIQFSGVDISETAVKYATKRASASGIQAQFIQRDCLSDRLPTGYDVITCGLFIHHLDEVQIVKLLGAMQSAAGLGMIVCDLERSRLNLAAVWIAAHALTRSPMVHGDAIKSVHAALTRHEFARLAEKALGRPVRVVGLPPCRFIMVTQEAVQRIPEIALARVQTT